MSNLFQSVVGSKKRYNNFNLSREVLVSGQIGKLIPVQCDEVVPGDYFKQEAAFLTRFSPLSAPAMARFHQHFHTFYVPYRIITPETSRESTYEKFIKSIGKHSSEVPMLPTLIGNTYASGRKFFSVGSLADYLGFPVKPNDITLTVEQSVSAMPFLAYQRIYQDFYRRDQIEPEIVFPSNVVQCNMSTGNFINATYDELEPNQVKGNVYDLFTLQTKNYERDYFTSALPEPQFGDEVTIGDGNISWLPTGNTSFEGIFPIDVNNGTALFRADVGAPSGYYGLASAGTNPASQLFITQEGGQELASALQGNSITINEFRLAMQLQGLKEKINRVGTRYLEIMEGIYGVRVPDARLQRPVYLGGFKNPVTIGSVMQTSESNTTPQGTLTGQMSASGSNNLCNGRYKFLEHGYLITIMSITPRTSYYGGMPRKFMKRYPEEFYLPDFDHLGEQPIYKSELYFDTDSEGHPSFDGEPESTNNQVFGYTPRYSEYKSAFSTVHGEFRTTLENWHVSRDFDSAPSLNPDFIKAEPEDFDRIFQFQDIQGTSNEHFQCQIYIHCIAKRNMSKYSTPYTLY